jgi:hypothetical protein
LNKKAASAGNHDGLDPKALFESDPWYAPVRERTTNLEKLITDLKGQIEKQQQIMQGAVATFMDDRWQNEYDAVSERIQKSKSIKDWDLPKLRQYAVDNKTFDKRGLPSIREAVNKLTEQEQKEATAQEAYERGLREGELKARMGVQPRPASASAAVSGSEKVPASLDEALNPASIAEDRELSEMLSQLGVAASQLTTN